MMLLYRQFIYIFELVFFVFIIGFHNYIFSEELIEITLTSARVEKTNSKYFPDAIWVRFKIKDLKVNQTRMSDSNRKNSLMKISIFSADNKLNSYINQFLINKHKSVEWLIIIDNKLNSKWLGKKLSINFQNHQKQIFFPKKSTTTTNIHTGAFWIDLSAVYCDQRFWVSPLGALKVINEKLNREKTFNILSAQNGITLNEFEYDFTSICTALFFLSDLNTKYKHGRQRKKTKNDVKFNECRKILIKLQKSKFNFISQYSLILLAFLDGLAGQFGSAITVLDKFDNTHQIWSVAHIGNKFRREIVRLQGRKCD